MKKILKVISFLIFSITIFASSNLEGIKQLYKYNLINDGQQITSKKGVVGIADRLEADAILELSDEVYNMYSDYKTFSKKHLIESEELLLIMPRIDILEKHIESLSKTTGKLYLFLMEGDKLDTEYGDRSYETFVAKGLQAKMPANVKVFKLTNASVTSTGTKNNFEFSDIRTSRVFIEQINPMYLKEKEKK